MVRGWGAGAISMMTMGSIVRLGSGLGRSALTRLRRGISNTRSRNSNTLSASGPDG